MCEFIVSNIPRQTKHNKYFGQSEDIRRRAIWAKNREWIIAHNARADKGLETYRLGENHYTDHVSKIYIYMYRLYNIV